MHRVLFFKQHTKSHNAQVRKHAKTQGEEELEEVKESQRRLAVEYLPLRRPLWNSPTVWESVRSKPTPLALIIFGLWPDWWKKTLLWRFFFPLGDHNRLKSELSGCLFMQSTRRDSSENSALADEQTPFCAAQLSRGLLSWQQQTPPLPSMHRGCPHKDWQHGCSCKASRGREHGQWAEDWVQLLAHWQCILCVCGGGGVNKSKVIFSKITASTKWKLLAGLNYKC